MHFIGLLALPLVLVANSDRSNVEFTKDSLDVVKQHIAEEKAVLVDVRSEQEWKQGHLEGALFVPVTSLRKGGDPQSLAKMLPQKKILYTFCVVGMRAKTAAYALEKHGYTVRALKPSYDDLLKAGFRKAKPESPGQSDESTRQRNAQ